MKKNKIKTERQGNVVFIGDVFRFTTVEAWEGLLEAMKARGVDVNQPITVDEWWTCEEEMSKLPVAEFSGLELKKRRQDLGLTQQRLAEIFGVMQGTISDWENCKINMQHPNIMRLAMDFLAISEL